jgi:hypothetical protein
MTASPRARHPRPARKRRPLPAARKLNCWEFKKCGRGPGNEPVCPAATDARADGINGGDNGGRVCWVIAGTLCGGRQQGAFAVKIDTCLRCDFCQMVLGEEQAEACEGYVPLRKRR